MLTFDELWELLTTQDKSVENVEPLGSKAFLVAVDSLTFFGKRHYWQFLVSGYEFCCVYNMVNKICKIISLVS
jgi:hypothetical protein